VKSSSNPVTDFLLKIGIKKKQLPYFYWAIVLFLAYELGGLLLWGGF